MKNYPAQKAIKPGLEPTIYPTRGEHANHYATDAVIFIFVGKCKCLLHLAIFNSFRNLCNINMQALFSI
jgi:hypothetical protein